LIKAKEEALRQTGVLPQDATISKLNLNVIPKKSKRGYITSDIDFSNFTYKTNSERYPNIAKEFHDLLINHGKYHISRDIGDGKSWEEVTLNAGLFDDEYLNWKIAPREMRGDGLSDNCLEEIKKMASGN
jgi:hypothetical protein